MTLPTASRTSGISANPDTHEQVIADAGAMGDAAGWVKGGEICMVSLWNGAPLLVDAPGFVELAVIQTDPDVRGDTSSCGSKPARLETGAVVRVPLFVMRGETIRSGYAQRGLRCAGEGGVAEMPLWHAPCAGEKRRLLSLAPSTMGAFLPERLHARPEHELGRDRPQSARSGGEH